MRGVEIRAFTWFWRNLFVNAMVTWNGKSDKGLKYQMDQRNANERYRLLESVVQTSETSVVEELRGTLQEEQATSQLISGTVHAMAMTITMKLWQPIFLTSLIRTIVPLRGEYEPMLQMVVPRTTMMTNPNDGRRNDQLAIHGRSS